jgi:hypothetical protein
VQLFECGNPSVTPRTIVQDLLAIGPDSLSITHHQSCRSISPSTLMDDAALRFPPEGGHPETG